MDRRSTPLTSEPERNKAHGLDMLFFVNVLGMYFQEIFESITFALNYVEIKNVS